MPFRKGDPNINRKGRKKGSTNKITKEVKEAFSMVLHNKLPELERWLTQVSHDDPAKAAEILMKLSERFLPILARTEITGADGEDVFKNVKFEFGPEKAEDDEVEE